MEEKKEVTVEQLLRITARQLSEIPVQVNQIDTVGVPIKQAVDNIMACLDVFENAAKQQAAAQQKTEEEPQIEVFTGEEPPEG